MNLCIVLFSLLSGVKQELQRHVQQDRFFGTWFHTLFLVVRAIFSDDWGLGSQNRDYGWWDSGRSSKDSAMVFLRDAFEHLLEERLGQSAVSATDQQLFNEELEGLGCDVDCSSVLELEQHVEKALTKTDHVSV
jgi:hypothetical protein